MKTLTCILCPNGCTLTIETANETIDVTGNMCSRGRDFAINEFTNPKRSVCSTVRTIFKDTPRLPVRTDGEIPRKFIFPVMEELNKVVIEKPVHSGEIILGNVLNTGINIISSSDMYLFMGE